MSQTVLPLIRQVESGDPSRIVGEDLDGGTITLGELSARSNRVANALVAEGVAPGDRVAYTARNRIEYMEVEWGIAKAGAVRVPMYHQLSKSDIERGIDLTAARVLIADAGAISSGRVEDAKHKVTTAIAFGGGDGWVDYESWIGAQEDDFDAIDPGPEAPYHVRLTSGSSGLPKGVVVSHRAARMAMLTNNFILNTEGRTERPKTLQQAPVTLASGWTVLPTLLSGGVNVFADRFDAAKVVDVFVEHEITWTFFVSTMLRMMVAKGADLSKLQSSSLQCLAYGGEPPPVDVMEAFIEHTDALVQVYGQTEAPSWTAYLSRKDHLVPELRATAGFASPGCEMGILVDGKVQIRDTEPGELVFRGDNISSELLGGEEEYARRLHPDGWWSTGDNGVIGRDGRLTLIGRQSEMIIRGGTNVHPSEVERVLGEHPDVDEVIVVGVPDATWGEVPVALVQSTTLELVGGAEILGEWAARSLARYKRPADIYIQREALPRLDVDAKVSRPLSKQLVARLREGSGTARK